MPDTGSDGTDPNPDITNVPLERVLCRKWPMVFPRALSHVSFSFFFNAVLCFLILLLRPPIDLFY